MNETTTVVQERRYDDRAIILFLIVTGQTLNRGDYPQQTREIILLNLKTKTLLHNTREHNKQ